MKKIIKKGKKRDVLDFKCSKCGAKWQSDEWSDIWWEGWFRADYCLNCKKYVETSSPPSAEEQEKKLKKQKDGRIISVIIGCLTVVIIVLLFL